MLNSGGTPPIFLRTRVSIQEGQNTTVTKSLANLWVQPMKIHSMNFGSMNLSSILLDLHEPRWNHIIGSLIWRRARNKTAANVVFSSILYLDCGFEKSAPKTIILINCVTNIFFRSPQNSFSMSTLYWNDVVSFVVITQCHFAIRISANNNIPKFPGHLPQWSPKAAEFCCCVGTISIRKQSKWPPKAVEIFKQNLRIYLQDPVDYIGNARVTMG